MGFFIVGILIGAVVTALACIGFVQARMAILRQRASEGKYFSLRDRSTYPFLHACGMFGAIFVGSPVAISMMLISSNLRDPFGEHTHAILVLVAVGLGYSYGYFNWIFIRRHYADEFQKLFNAIDFAVEERRKKRT